MVDLRQLESALAQDPAVLDCVARRRRTRDDSEETVIYIVPSGPMRADAIRSRIESLTPSIVGPWRVALLPRLPLTADSLLDEKVLEASPVVDEDLARRWEDELRKLQGIEEASVILRPRSSRRKHHHLSDLLPATGQRPGEDRPRAPRQNDTAPRSAGSHLSSGRPALSHGGLRSAPLGAPRTLAETLMQAAKASPAAGVVYIDSGGVATEQTYQELLVEALAMVSGLRHAGARPGDKVMLQVGSSRDLIPAFWASTLAGLVPLPLSVAQSYEPENATIQKLRSGWSLLEEPLVLTSDELMEPLTSLNENFGGRLRAVSTGQLRRFEPEKDPYRAHPSDLALLLMTSGSTGIPKIVTHTHETILNRPAADASMNGFTSNEVTLNWMPLEHVVGLVMFHVRDVYLGCRQIHAPTNLVVENPLLWLDWMEHFRVTVTWAPNFAFALVNDRAAEIDRRKWDLRSVKCILNGGEAVVPKTARRFLQLLTPHGLSKSAMVPGWGMSETSSGVVFSERFSRETTSDDDQYVELGLPIQGISLRIVDESDEILGEGAIGRLQIRGDTVTPGYYENPALNREAFTEDGWFTTGDLGFLREGRLTLTGREKNEIIINGINHVASEIESAVEDVEGVEVSFTAACAVRPHGSETDRLVVFFHPKSGDDAGLAKLLRQIRRRVAESIGTPPTYLVALPRESVSKTITGKIQHRRMKDRFESGEFDEIAKRADLLLENENTIPDWFFRPVWRRREAARSSGRHESTRALVVCDDSGLGSSLGGRLRAMGVRTSVVASGSAFTSRSDDFHIDVEKEDDYYRLWEAVSSEGDPVDLVIHLLGYDKSEGMESLRALEASQRRNSFSLLWLAQAMSRIQGEHRARLFCAVSRTQTVASGDHVEPDKRLAAGLLTALDAELEWLSCRHVDLEGHSGEKDLEDLLREVAAPGREREVAYRGGKRLIPRLERVSFGVPARPPFSRGAFYLLSGGLGGVGAVIAAHLLRTHQARLLLLGRTELPPRERWDDALKGDDSIAERVRTYLELEQLGGELRYRAVDVCDQSRVREVVEGTPPEWGVLRGVFHLAGDYRPRGILQETAESLGEAMRAKLQGSWVLERLPQIGPDCFFVSASSVGSFFSWALGGAYAAANRFLGGLGERKRPECRHYCIDWSMWRDVGLSRLHPMGKLAEARGFQVIDRKKALQSLLVALHHDERRLVVGIDADHPSVRPYVDEPLEPVLELAGFYVGDPIHESQSRLVSDQFGVAVAHTLIRKDRFPRTVDGTVDRRALAGEGAWSGERRGEEEVQSELERVISGVWREILGGQEVGVHENFFELGGNSIQASQVASRLSDVLPFDFSVRTVFEHPTVSDLAQILVSASAPSLVEVREQAGASHRAPEASAPETLGGS